MTTKPIEPRLSKLAKNTDSSIQSCSLECFRIEVNNVLKLQNDFEVSEADLEEKLKNYEAQLNREKQKPIEVRARIRDLEVDTVKVMEEKNQVNVKKLVKLNRKQDMETKIKMLSSVKMNSKDEQKISVKTNYHKMYKHLTNVRWNSTAGSHNEGYIFNRNDQLEWFSVPYSSTNHEENVEKMWSLISKASDWSKDIM